MKTISTRHIERYISMQKEAGVSIRTLQNRVSHIRGELRAMGRHQLAEHERLSCKALGISGASRAGTHRALSQEQYQAVLTDARQRHQGFAACLELQRELGLRMSEAIQCGDSLRSWEKALQQNRSVRILHGTKGGRARDTMPNDHQKALEAVQNALQALKEGEGRLIPSKTLEGATKAYGRLCISVGLKGEHASHALRCSYAQERYLLHLERLGDRKEALAATSLDLGHGDGRGTYVAQVYLAR